MLKAGGGGGGTSSSHRHVPEFLRLLRAGGAAAESSGAQAYAPLLALLRGMSAAAIDRELRAMQVHTQGGGSRHAMGESLAGTAQVQCFVSNLTSIRTSYPSFSAERALCSLINSSPSMAPPARSLAFA